MMKIGLCMNTYEAYSVHVLIEFIKFTIIIIKDSA